MKYLIYINLIFVFVIICVFAKNENEIDTDTETDCGTIEAEYSSVYCDTYNNVNNPEFKNPRSNDINPRSGKKKIQITDKRVTLLSRPDSIPVHSKDMDYSSIYTNSSDEFDSTENAIRNIDDFRNESIEIFTTPNISVATNTTTIESATWTYQAVRSFEESDESKTTLIDYPFSVSIQRKGAHYASGALLDNLWIITSAGDFYNVRESLKLFRARLGSVDCKRGGIVIPIRKIEIHPYYIHGKPNFDVALLRLAFHVVFTDFIRPIAISNVNGKLISAKFMTTYWPRILLKGLALPLSARERIRYNSMRVSTQRLIPEHKCSQVMATYNLTLNEASLCLKPVVTHHSICKPDAGAPVIAEDGLWGITSGWISPKCPDVAAPTIFTRLSSLSVRSWLDKELLSSV